MKLVRYQDQSRPARRRGLAMRSPQGLKAGDGVRAEIDRTGTIESVTRPRDCGLNRFGRKCRVAES
jgi:hypothetical protein